jgi:hypothetical protein
MRIMTTLIELLVRVCKAANISIDPDKENIDLKEIFTELRQKGLITEKTLLDIEKAMQ